MGNCLKCHKKLGGWEGHSTFEGEFCDNCYNKKKGNSKDEETKKEKKESQNWWIIIPLVIVGGILMGMADFSNLELGMGLILILLISIGVRITNLEKKAGIRK